MERDFIKTAEVIGKGLRVAQKVGQTILSPFKGGWTELNKPPSPTQPASITVFEDESHITRGEE